MARALFQNKTKKKKERKKEVSLSPEGSNGRRRPYILLLVGISIPFVLVILLSDRHSVPGGLVNVVICLYPHFVGYGAEALQASTKKKKNKKAEVNSLVNCRRFFFNSFLILNKCIRTYIIKM